MNLILSLISVWAIVWDNEQVKNELSAILYMNSDNFDIGVFLKVSGSILIAIGILFEIYGIFFGSMLSIITTSLTVLQTHSNIMRYLILYRE